MRVNLPDDDNVWAAMVAAKFARHPAINLPHGNLWEPQIAKALAKAVREGRKDRDQIEMLMALQLGVATIRSRQGNTVEVDYNA